MSTETIEKPKTQIRDKNGKWLNSGAFREEAVRFMSNGYYCVEPKGSPGYREYWDEQLRRCKEGYVVGGQKITQHHYHYLNFTQIEIVEYDEDGEEVAATKETKCPDFWDGDYDYYWSLEIAKNGLFTKNALASTELEKQVYKTLPGPIRDEWKQKVLKRIGMRVVPHPEYLDGGNHMIVGKSRRKGYSYKNAAICANVYNTIRKAKTLIGAYDKKYSSATMDKASLYLSFLNKHTAWGKGREFTNQADHKKASFKETINGVEVESGYLSEIKSITFMNNSDAARGTDGKIVLFEEAGVFPNLKASYLATKPSLEAGKFTIGQMLVFGTGGDMESGTVDFAAMFYNPIEFGLMPFLNIWDENAGETYVGFFHPMYMNYEGFYDSQGNSDVEGCIAYEKAYREKLTKSSTSSNVLQARVQEYPLGPSEAFLTVSTNDFPVIELQNRLNKLRRENLHLKLGTPVHIFKDTENGGKASIRPDFDGLIQPLWSYKPKTTDYKGGVVIFEAPIAGIKKGFYKIGFDPYRMADSAASVPSMAAIYVYKGYHKYSERKNQIVAQYVGRPYSPDDVNRIAELLALLYNTEVMHENEVTHVKDYFTRRKCLHLLAVQPDTVIDANVNNSKVKRKFGCHMTDKLKDAGEKYIKQWLLETEDFDEDGNPVCAIDHINDPALLEELILYNRKGNFDRVMALMMVMFQVKEEELGDEDGTDEEEMDSIEKDLEDQMNTQFRNAA